MGRIREYHRLKREQAKRRYEKHRRRNYLARAGVHDFVVVLDNLKQSFNIGKIFRSADAMGAAVGATRDVVDRGWLTYDSNMPYWMNTITTIDSGMGIWLEITPGLPLDVTFVGLLGPGSQQGMDHAEHAADDSGQTRGN